MTIRRIAFVLASAAVSTAVAISGSHAQRRARPPEQPASGPEGRSYSSASVRAGKYGQGATGYWLFEPAEPAPDSAPLVVFNHGWNGLDPDVYGAWLEHIVRRGNVVVYPLYQDGPRTPPAEFTTNATAAIRDAIARLQTQGHVRPQLDRFAIVGHSAGGNISADLAALAARSGLPVPRALMCVEPGKSWMLAPAARIPLVDLGTIPATTLVLAVAGDADRLAREVDAKRIVAESTAVPAENKDFVLVVSDDHGDPALTAHHLAPCAPAAITSGASRRSGGRASVDALDYYGYWKLFDALCDAAFYGRDREYALGNTPRQRFMGTWSDGMPVRELVVTDAP